MPGDRLANLDFAAHNADQLLVWQGYHNQSPSRTPIIFGTNTRYFMLNVGCNSDGTTFEEYSRSPEIMFDTALKFQRWSLFNILQDAMLGLPDRWVISPDYQNYYEASWFGCTVHYFPQQVPDTLPDFCDKPERLIEQGIPGPFDRIYGRALDYYQYFLQRAGRETYLDRPITVAAPNCGFGTDGPFTVACNLFGAPFVCENLASDPDRIVKLLQFITEATIHRIRAWRSLFHITVKSDNWGMADDSIALISSAMYRDYILPLHQLLYDSFATQSGRSMHLCGNASRHFGTMVKDLGISQFDTGFPIDFARVRAELGPSIRILGGPHIELLRKGTPEEISTEVKRIFESGIAKSGHFVLRDANNLAPYTPLGNMEAMYYAGLKYGKESRLK